MNTHRVAGREVAGYIVMTTVWGSSFFFTAFALRSFGPLTIVLLRLALAAVVLGLIVALSRPALPRTRAEWLHLAWLGCFNITLPNALLTAAQQHVTSSLSIVLASTTPLFVFALAVIAGTERFNAHRLAGILLSLSGIVALTARGGEAGTDSWLWPLMVVASSAIYAAGNVYTRRYLASLPPLSTAWLQITFGALWAVPAVVLLDGWQVGEVTPVAVLALVELGVVSSAVCYILFFWFIRAWGSTATSMNTYLQPIVGVLLGVLVLHERPTEGAGLALLLVALGIGCFGWDAWRRLRSRQPHPDPEPPSVG